MKKRLLSILLTAIMVLSMLPALAFAEDGGEAAPLCICETACTAEEMNKDCPVCSAEGALPENCGKYVKPADEAVTQSEGGKEAAPVCTCETACTAEEMNKDCPVCSAEGALPENCGKYVKPADEAVTQSEGGKEAAPVCTCETACTAEEMNKNCPVCGAEGAAAENCAKYVEPADDVPTQPEGEPVTLNDGGETWTDIGQDYFTNHKNSKRTVTLGAGSYRLTGNISFADSDVYALDIEGKVTLDLNGYELKNTIGASSAVYVEENAELTLVDGSEAQSGVIRRTKREGESYVDAIGVSVSSGAAFIMNGGTIVADSYCVSSSGTFTMNGGTIQGNGSQSVGVANRDKMHANGGMVEDCARAALYNDGTIQVDSNASGTEFYGDASNGSRYAATISGGIFHGIVSNAWYGTISGGTFNGYVGNANGAVISGGVFNDVVLNYSDQEIQGTFNAGIVTGSGMAEKPYHISSAAQLKWFCYAVNSELFTNAYAVLDDDIDLGSEAWTPIGTSDRPYTGTFDGQRHTVSGLSVSGDLEAAGLFGYTNGATIRNLIVSGSVTSTCTYSTGKVGGIVGCANGGTIENCGNLCTVNGYDAGGIVGCAYGPTISACYNAGNISYSGNGGVGGIVGFSSDPAGKIYDCYNVGAIHSGWFAGGIVSMTKTKEDLVYNCYNAGAVTGDPARGIGNGIQCGNCYYLKGTAVDYNDNVTEKSADDFADGTVLAQLKGGTHNGEDPWAKECQYVDAAGKVLPVFKWQGATHIHRSGGWQSDGTDHWKTCDVCNAEFDRAAHSGTDDGDCTTEVVCGECGYVITAAAKAHTWGSGTPNGNGTHTRRCTAQGCKATKTDNCSGGTATCKEKAKCAVCGQAYGELAAHSFTAEVVDAKYRKSPATCTAKAVYYKSCAACGEKGTETFETGNVLGHDWGEWNSNGDGTHTRVCKRDESHTETVSCSGGTATCTEEAICKDCGGKYGEKDPANHTGKKEWTATKTKHQQKWSCCGEVTVAKESHTFGDWVVTKKATSRKDGKKTRTCEVCEYVEEATIPATGGGLLSPKTGDDSHVGMWAGILCVSLAGIIALVVLYKKKHKK